MSVLVTIFVWLAIGSAVFCVSAGGYTLAWDLTKSKTVTLLVGTPITYLMVAGSFEFLRIL